ncbi:MAG: adenylosuccinate synthetase [Candidatus Omnitrophica bacterium]|jgi:adenylosuccinate synthase|nr:adenylosuccinate synthetase [Candidatus Omnitrophota bacterium]
MSIVLGLGFGDEGKGLTTSFLCSHTTNPLVVRFNGGHQVGHTVVYNNNRHVFSSFGSGTLQGVPTYWSKFCTVYPTAFLNEYKLLTKTTPLICVNPLCPVTTPYDIIINDRNESFNQHGSIGVGFGQTIERHENNFFKLFVQDLFFENVLVAKLKNIATWYKLESVDISNFMSDCITMSHLIRLSDDNIIHNYNPIFEGGQGILLDQSFGFFPNVTRSNTTSENALKLFNDTEVFYVTRTYQTRHGNGVMSNENDKLLITNNEFETNQYNKYQGKFRVGELDTSLMNYSLGCDNNFSIGLVKNLMITCCDQYHIDVDELLSKLGVTFNKVFLSYGNSLDDVIQYI